MSENKDELVVKAGFATVKTQVGAGMAYVDVAQGERLPDDVSDEERDALVRSGAVGPREAGKQDPDADVPTDPDGNPVARPVPGLVEPDEIPADIIPGGSTEQIMDWIGDDLARARVARHEELAKGNDARAGLVEQIESKMAELETEPPSVPEHLAEDGGPGGVVLPEDGPDPNRDKPARKATKATRPTSK